MWIPDARRGMMKTKAGGGTKAGARGGSPVLFWVTAVFLAATPGPVFGQAPYGADVALVGGHMSYDVDTLGDGAVGFGGIRIRLSLGGFLLVEPGVTYALIQADTVGRGGDVDTPTIISEFQFQFQYPVGRFQPYAGVGAGGMLDLRDDRGGAREGEGPADFLVSTYSTALGVATDRSGWTFRVEVRQRWIDDFDDSAVELTAAIGRMF